MIAVEDALTTPIICPTGGPRAPAVPESYILTERSCMHVQVSNTCTSSSLPNMTPKPHMHGDPNTIAGVALRFDLTRRARASSSCMSPTRTLLLLRTHTCNHRLPSYPPPPLFIYTTSIASSITSHLISSHKHKKKQQLARMAPNFGRSISFPLTPTRSFSKPRHVRSISLPGTTSSHPLLANLHAHIAAVRSWIQQDPSSSLPSGLAAIQALHSSLADLLLFPESGAALRCPTNNAADRLLDAFLLLADTHQGFQECLLSLRHAATESRAALRRGDTGRLASAARSQRRAEKELARLAASISAIFSKSARLNLVAVSGEEAEMAYALVEAAAASAVASAAVFSAAASMSSAASSSKKTATFIPAFARRAATAPETAEATVERLHALERCLDECDGACDMVFRSIVQNRVSLLNIMTPTI